MSIIKLQFLGDIMCEVILEKQGPSLYFYREGKKAEYNFADKKYYLHKNNGKREVKSLQKFFVNCRIDDLRTDDVAYQKFLEYISMNNRRLKSIQRFLELMGEYSEYEKLFVYDGLDVIIDRNTRRYNYSNDHICPISHYSKSFLDYLVKYDIPLTKNLSRFKHVFDAPLIKLMQKGLQKEKLGDLLYEFRDRWTSWRFGELLTGMETYNLDETRTFEYIKYVEMYEGLEHYESIDTYLDYLRMATAVKNKIEKYPKHLLSVEKIHSKMYMERKTEYDRAAFKTQVDKMKHLEYSDNKYSVILPKEPQDLIDEGKELSHCVGSYCNSVMKGRTNILFLRKNKEIDKPYVTIEIQNNRIGQISAKYNYRPEEEDLEFLRKYCRVRHIDMEDSILKE